jgi:hypothetical protein
MATLEKMVLLRLQDHFSDALVTIIGSGHSAALGIPGMAALADELVREMPARAGSAGARWQSVAEELGRGVGLERALDSLTDEDELISQVVDVTSPSSAPPRCRWWRRFWMAHADWRSPS